MITTIETENGNEQDVQVSLTLQHLAPWLEKTDGLESVGAWENNLATKMMVKLLELWITPESKAEVEKVLEYYHPLDRAAMAYALVVYVLTGHKMEFISAMATLQAAMDTYAETKHMKYMVYKYGPKKIKH